MNLARRQKFGNQGRTIIKSERPKIDINFDINVLNLMCSYILSENSNIRKGGLINLRNLWEIINIDLYRNDIEKMSRITFIKKGLEARLLKNLNNPIMIIQYINGGIIDEDFIDTSNFNLLSNEELEYLNETVSGALKYAFMYNDVDRIMDVCNRFKAADYRNRQEIVQEFETILLEVVAKFRRVRTESSSEMTFSLRGGKYEEVLSDIHAQLNRPSRILTTGMVGVNEMLGINNGFEGGRSYLYLGNTGSMKSITLLNLAIQIKKFNKGFKAKDPTKIPCVVVMTMENSCRETVERLYSICTGGDLSKTPLEEAMNRLRLEGELYLTDESPIDIIIKYVPDKSVDTGYLYTLTEDLEDDGYEVICMIQDHVKKIRSCYKASDMRIELGEIINEMSTFAKIKDVVMITNAHLNREANKIVEEGSKANKFDLVRQLGRANVGESMLMIDNVDCAYTIGPQYDADGNFYMGFNRIKSRVKCNMSRDYICQPFASPDSIKLVEDYYSPVPVFKESLKPNIAETNLYNNGVGNNRQGMNSAKDINEIFNNKKGIPEDNIFNTTSRYRSTTVYTEVDEETMPLAVVGRPHADIIQPKQLFNPLIKVS